MRKILGLFSILVGSAAQVPSPPLIDIRNNNHERHKLLVQPLAKPGSQYITTMRLTFKIIFLQSDCVAFCY